MTNDAAKDKETVISAAKTRHINDVEAAAIAAAAAQREKANIAADRTAEAKHTAAQAAHDEKQKTAEITYLAAKTKALSDANNKKVEAAKTKAQAELKAAQDSNAQKVTVREDMITSVEQEEATEAAAIKEAQDTLDAAVAAATEEYNSKKAEIEGEKQQAYAAANEAEANAKAAATSAKAAALKKAAEDEAAADEAIAPSEDEEEEEPSDVAESQDTPGNDFKDPFP